MEKRFCGKCGKPLAECVCKDRAYRPPAGEALRPTGKTPVESGWIGGKRTIKRFQSVALGDGEVPVRQYQVGRIEFMGAGTADVLVTNRRVIAQSQSSYMGMASNSVQEVEIASITGVSSYVGKGFKMNLVRIAVALCALAIAMYVLAGVTRGPFGGIGTMLLIGAVLIGALSRRPSFVFSVSANNSGSAMSMNVNVSGVALSSNGGNGGLIFSFTPTKDSMVMMKELGACIMDIKAMGDHAISTWSNV